MQFSIIIPAKNEEANIGRCLDSINSIEWDNSQYEVLVIDNGSSDRTLAIASAKGAKVYVRPELTIAGLRNFGARQASGDILAFIDADCTVQKFWLVTASKYIHNKEVVCFGSPPIVPDDATWIPKAWFAVRKKGGDICEVDWLESMNMFVRREPFTAVGGFDEALITCEDYDLTMRLKKFGSVFSDTSIVAVHHGEASTISHFFRKELWRGKSNFAGMMQHGISMSEIPSLVAPSFHCIVLICFFVSPFIGYVTATVAASACFLLWQIFLLLTSFRKIRDDFNIPLLFQLYLLLNIYLVARGVGVFTGGRRVGASQCVA